MASMMPRYSDDFREIFSVQYDNPGHGKFYKTPSYAESIFVACKTYDERMNSIIDAAIAWNRISQGSKKRSIRWR